MPELRAWWAWVGACGPVGGSRAMRYVARGFWRVDVSQVSESGTDPSRVAECSQMLHTGIQSCLKRDSKLADLSLFV